MKKQKLLLIESYIYAKTLFIFTNNASIIFHDYSIHLSINNIKTKAKTLLDLCEKKIYELRLNNASFLILKKELESANEIIDKTILLRKINNLKDDYNYHFENVKNISSWKSSYLL